MSNLAGFLPDTAEHKTPPATQARAALIDSLRKSVDGEGPISVPAAPVVTPTEEPPQPPAAQFYAPRSSGLPESAKSTPEDLLDNLLKFKTPDQVFLMVMDKMPAHSTLTTKVGRWTVELRAISCTVDDTQLNFVADKRQNQCLPDEIGGVYDLTYKAKEYPLVLLGVSFFPSPSSPFVLVSFLRKGGSTTSD